MNGENWVNRVIGSNGVPLTMLGLELDVHQVVKSH